MVLEATIICLDNSAYSVNGDFPANRLDAQTQASSLVAAAKIQENGENAVGLLTMGADKTNVILSPTPDLSAFLQSLHSIPSSGEADFVRGLQTAQLALKHRLNKNQRQRVVLFVCSPITATEKQLEQLGKTLKKNSISIDIISFGETEQNSALLTRLYEAVNSNNTSHLLEIQESQAGMILSDLITQSPIVRGEGVVRGPPSAMQVGGTGDEFDVGVDPSVDPELYMALRLSLEEERARQRRVSATAASPDRMQFELNTSASGGPPASGFMASPSQSDLRPGGEQQVPADGNIPTRQEIESMDIAEDLRQALLLSLQDYVMEAPTTGRQQEPDESSKAGKADQGAEPSVPDSHGDAPMHTPRGLETLEIDPDTLQGLIKKYSSKLPPGVDLYDPEILKVMLEMEDELMEDAQEEHPSNMDESDPPSSSRHDTMKKSATKE